MLRFEKKFHVDVPVQKLWPLISDTERMNRAAGLPSVDYQTEANDLGPATVKAQARMGPFTLRWQEFPFEWIAEQHYHVRRRYAGGPMREMRPGMDLTPAGGGTDVRVFLEVYPRNVLGSVMAKAVMWPGVLKKFRALIAGMEAHLAAQAPDPFWKAEKKPSVDGRRLEVLGRRLKEKGFSLDLVEALTRHLTDAPEIEVAAIRPFALADRWKKDRIEVLKMFLQATREGMLELSWDILCPGCRKSNASSGSLSGLHGNAHCDYCQIDYGPHFDQSVEARFRVHPSVRRAERREFCAGGPGNTPHILAQILLQPGEKRKLRLRVLGSPLRVFSPRVSGMARVCMVDSAASNKGEVALTAQGVTPDSLQLRSGAVELALENRAQQERWCIIAREAWDEAVATAAQVTSLQDFRDMFSSEVLSPGEEIAVKSMTFMFTDLAGSTAAYHDLGDARAYSMVREHFTVLKKVIAQHRGAVVKTIGDAVMAVFYTPKDGMQAALHMQEAIGRWNAKRGDGKRMVLKIGLHEGPAIAVNTEDVLDYFGTSVNLTARVEAQALGGDIVISGTMAEALDTEKYLQQRMKDREKLSSPVKGFPKPVEAWRIRPGVVPARSTH